MLVSRMLAKQCLVAVSGVQVTGVGTSKSSSASPPLSDIMRLDLCGHTLLCVCVCVCVCHTVCLVHVHCSSLYPARMCVHVCIYACTYVNVKGVHVQVCMNACRYACTCM